MRHIVSYIGVLGLICLVMTPGARGSVTSRVPAMPMAIPFEDTIRHRWLDKTVLESRLLDDMEELDGWSHGGFGASKDIVGNFPDGRK